MQCMIQPDEFGYAYAEHTVYKTKFVKYIYDESQEGNYAKLAEGKDLFPFPDDDTSKDRWVGQQEKNRPGSTGLEFGYWFGTEVDASPRHMRILKMTKTEVVMMLEVTKPWLVAQHRYEHRVKPELSKEYTKDSAWITPYLIVYNLKEDGTYEYTDALQATDAWLDYEHQVRIS